MHIQLAVTDLDRAIEFYSRVFNWKVVKSEGIPDYAFYTIDDEGELVGGGFGLTDQQPSTGTVSLYINSDDIPATLQDIEEAGGRTLQEMTLLPDSHGYVARFEDPFGNALGLWMLAEEEEEEEDTGE